MAAVGAAVHQPIGVEFENRFEQVVRVDGPDRLGRGRLLHPGRPLPGAAPGRRRRGRKLARMSPATRPRQVRETRVQGADGSAPTPGGRG